MTAEEYTQFKAFVKQDGLYIAALWTVSFACIIGEFTWRPLGSIGIFIALLTPFFVVNRLRRYRDWGLNGKISFARAFTYGVTLFLAASLLFALVQYIYFQFIDKGYLLEQYNLIMSSKAMQEAMAAYNVKQQMEQSLQMMSQMTAMEKAANMLPMNIFIGVLMSLPIAMIMKRDKATAQSSAGGDNINN